VLFILVCEERGLTCLVQCVRAGVCVVGGFVWMVLSCTRSFGILLVVFTFVQGVVDDVTSQTCVGRATFMKAWLQV